MEIGVLGYIGSRNIGDYIQTMAVIDMIYPISYRVLDRETLHNFNGTEIKTIINEHVYSGIEAKTQFVFWKKVELKNEKNLSRNQYRHR